MHITQTVKFFGKFIILIDGFMSPFNFDVMLKSLHNANNIWCDDCNENKFDLEERKKTVSFAEKHENNSMSKYGACYAFSTRKLHLEAIRWE